MGGLLVAEKYVGLAFDGLTPEQLPPVPMLPLPTQLEVLDLVTSKYPRVITTPPSVRPAIPPTVVPNTTLFE